VPRVGRDVRRRDCSTRVLGQDCAVPFILAPTGLAGLTRRGGECLAARAAERAGALFCLSQMAGTRIADVRAATAQPFWLQLYLMRDRDINRRLIDRARHAGCSALVVTVDTKVQGIRERDLRNGFTVPPRLTLRNAVDALRCWRWSLDFLLGPRVSFANLAEVVELSGNLITVAQFVAANYDLAYDWEAIAWCKEQWGGPLAVKGVLHPEDARLAVAHGADAVIVSNHGGRQVDGVLSAIAALPAVCAAVAGRAEVILDGGVRRGNDVLKALALGARACMFGRPYLYALAAAGEAGVTGVLNILREELDNTMVLTGQNSLRALPADLVVSP
jgi:L-lactate dehydrogenase (cytochrome)